MFKIYKLMKKIIYLGIICLIFTNIGFAQKKEDRKPKDTLEHIQNLPEIKVFSASKFEENKLELPSRIDAVTQEIIEFGMPQTAGELLVQSGLVFQQTSQLGAGSPVIRGFEANRVLLVIDGVRMNNAIYRSGHLQNVITIDPNALERVEILQGPGSVIYGSDALGGVMAFYTKNPTFATGDRKFLASGSATVNFQSATLSPSANFTLSLAGKKFASLTSATYKMVNDLRVGRNMNPIYGDWGLCTHYAALDENGKNITVKNDKPWIMKNSGYQQWDLLQKFVYNPTDDISLGLNFQYSSSTNIPRYDRLLNMKGSNMEYAEFYYGPQDRLFTYLTLDVKNKKNFDNMRITLGHQYLEENRIQRKYGKTNKRYQNEIVNVATLNVDFQKKLGKKQSCELRWGLEGTYNDVNSKAYNENQKTMEYIYDAVSRYPDSLGNVFSVSAYITNSWKINDHWIFTQGLRYTYQWLKAVYSIDMMELTKFPFDKKISNNSGAPTGSLGLVYLPGKDWKLSLNLSTGFKAPNIDDITKVNDSKADSRKLIVPNPNLKSEYVYNVDLGIEKTFAKKITIGVVGFFSINQNVVTEAKDQLNGMDTVLFDGEWCDVYSLQNIELGYITGVQGYMSADITKWFNINGNITYTYGRTIEAEPRALSHIPPVYGLLSFVFKYKGFMADFYIRYNGWKYAKDTNLEGEDNYNMGLFSEDGTEYYGYPSWFTLNLKASYSFNKYVSLQAGVENLLDSYYRLNASGISAPGINGMIGIRCNF